MCCLVQSTIACNECAKYTHVYILLNEFKLLKFFYSLKIFCESYWLTKKFNAKRSKDD